MHARLDEMKRSDYPGDDAPRLEFLQLLDTVDIAHEKVLVIIGCK